MRYEVTSKLRPASVLAQANSFFGEEGLGLRLAAQGDDFIAFDGGGGAVTVSAEGRENGSTVEVTSREWDSQAQQFLRAVSSAAGGE